MIEADIKHPTDAGLAGHGVRALAREGRKLQKLIGEPRARVRDRSRAMGRKLRGIARTIRRRSGEAKAEVLKLTAETGELLERSVKEARRLVAAARREDEAERSRPAGGVGRSVREGGPADPPAGGGREDHRPDRVARGPGRPADPQGQDRQAGRSSGTSVSWPRSPSTPGAGRAG